MIEKLQFLIKNTLILCQLIAAIISLFYFHKLKGSYWVWLAIYLVIIFVQEFFWFISPEIPKEYAFRYYIFIGVPIQFLFLFWLYALKSLKNKSLFVFSISIYAVSLCLSFCFKELKEVLSISNNIGSILLFVLIILEFIKQIKSDNILKFKENRMFYINIGLVLFYIGNYVYHVFGPELYKNHIDIWNVYHIYFLISNCLLYILFSMSIIWGKIL